MLGGANSYQYTSNSIFWIDPLGLAKKPALKIRSAMRAQVEIPLAKQKSWQGPLNYPYLGQDIYINVIVKKGTVLFTLYPHGPAPGNYFSKSDTVIANREARKFNDAVQVAHASNSTRKGEGRPMRTKLHAYINEYTCMAEGISKNNPQFGPGGGQQFFIENRNKIKLINTGKIISFKK